MAGSAMFQMEPRIETSVDGRRSNDRQKYQVYALGEGRLHAILPYCTRRVITLDVAEFQSLGRYIYIYIYIYIDRDMNRYRCACNSMSLTYDWFVKPHMMGWSTHLRFRCRRMKEAVVCVHSDKIHSIYIYIYMCVCVCLVVNRSIDRYRYMNILLYDPSLEQAIVVHALEWRDPSSVTRYRRWQCHFGRGGGRPDANE